MSRILSIQVVMFRIIICSTYQLPDYWSVLNTAILNLTQNVRCNPTSSFLNSFPPFYTGLCKNSKSEAEKMSNHYLHVSSHCFRVWTTQKPLFHFFFATSRVVRNRTSRSISHFLFKVRSPSTAGLFLTSRARFTMVFFLFGPLDDSWLDSWAIGNDLYTT
jgi:hypothetical protein